MDQDKLIASVIIPCYGRNNLLDRAIQSVFDCNGSERVEIIIVDDHSPEPITCPLLRCQDRIIRLEKNSGPSIGRNRGIEEAKGKMVYFLDSDDKYLSRDFIEDAENHSEENAIFYCEIDSQGFSSNYPEQLDENEYFSNIFYKLPHIAQTSSLCFPRKVGLRFDESLPKHEDWDLIFCQAIKNEVAVKKINGRIFFDRSDRTSLSRSPNGDKSLPWVKKISELLRDDSDFCEQQFAFHILAQYPPQYSWLNYFCNGLGLLVNGKTMPRPLLIKGIHRLIALGNRIKAS